MNRVNQFQNDVANVANSMVSAVVCAERGVDYNALMYQAQQQQLNQIVQAEQNRQMNKLVNQHYGGGGIVSRVKEAFTGSSMNMLSPTAGFGMPYMPMPMPMVPQPFMQAPQPQQIASQLIQTMPPQAPVADESARMDNLEKSMEELKNMFASLIQTEK